MSKKQVPAAAKPKPNGGGAGRSMRTTYETATIQRPANCVVEQAFDFVWFDENFDQNDPSPTHLVQELGLYIHSLDTFKTIPSFSTWMGKGSKRPVYLILSHPSKQAIDKLLKCSSRVKFIFIFLHENVSCDESWLKMSPKIRGAFKIIKDLCGDLKKLVRASETGSHDFSFVAPEALQNSDGDLLDPTFAYTQSIRDVLLQITYAETSFHQLVTYCHDSANGIVLSENDIKEIKNGYRSQDAACWYTKQTFLYGFVNRTFREWHHQHIPVLGFYVKDLHQNIEQLREEQKRTQIVKFPLYRGQVISREQLDQLQRSKNGLFSFNFFLSTSQSLGVAEGFAQTALQDYPDLCGIVFEINNSSSGSSVPYGAVRHLSKFSEEEEVLFSLGAVFRIGEITTEDGGKNWKATLQLANHDDQDLRDLMACIKKQIDGPTPMYRLGALMIRLDQYGRAIEIFEKLLTQSADDRERASIHYQIGFAQHRQGKNDQALENYNRALSIHERVLPEHHTDIATVHNNIGLVYHKMKKPSESINSYEKAKEIYELEKNRSTHPNLLAACYNNIASVYADDTTNYQHALDLHKKSFDLYQSQTVTNRASLALTANNMGLIHMRRGEKSQAFECFKYAVETGRKAHLPNHQQLKAYEQHLAMIS